MCLSNTSPIVSEGLVERTYVNEVCLYSNRINEPMRDLTSILKSTVNAVNEYVCAMGLLSDSPGIDTQLDRSGVVALGMLHNIIMPFGNIHIKNAI